MLTNELLRLHLQYTAWASARLLGAAAALSAEELTRDHSTADKSVLGTLVHVFAADRLWLARVNGETLANFIDDSDYSLDVLQRDWPKIGGGWVSWCDALPPGSASETLHYRDIKGRPFQNTIWEIVLHVVNHATHHRGQVSGFIRSMGHKPPPVDMTAYYRRA